MPAVLWAADETTTAPTHYETTPQESVLLVLDIGALLGQGETIASVATILTRLETEAAVMLADLPAVLDNAATVTQRLCDLTGGDSYRLRWTVTTSGGNKRSATTFVACRL